MFCMHGRQIKNGLNHHARHVCSLVRNHFVTKDVAWDFEIKNHESFSIVDQGGQRRQDRGQDLGTRSQNHGQDLGARRQDHGQDLGESRQDHGQNLGARRQPRSRGMEARSWPRSRGKEARSWQRSRSKILAKI